MIYSDTSFLLSIYITDSNSSKADAKMESVKEPLFWTPFHEVEFTTALESRVRRGQTLREQADNAYEALEMHRTLHGVFFMPAVDWSSVWSQATDLAGEKASMHECRSLDIIHLALAIELGTTEFLSFDHRQNALAKALDLKVLGDC